MCPPSQVRRSSSISVSPGRSRTAGNHDKLTLVRAHSRPPPEKSPPAAPVRATGGAGGTVRKVFGRFSGEPRCFPVRNRQLTGTVRGEDTPLVALNFLSFSPSWGGKTLSRPCRHGSIPTRIFQRSLHDLPRGDKNLPRFKMAGQNLTIATRCRLCVSTRLLWRRNDSKSQ